MSLCSVFKINTRPRGVEWSGVEWSGVEWSGVEWSGVEWSGVEVPAKSPISFKHTRKATIPLSNRRYQNSLPKLMSELPNNSYVLPLSIPYLIKKNFCL